ncbi:sigma 54-interacting transcriptional regulator [Megasphaera hominis]|uniref:Sigma 54-interacting transcriptional regulator n=1 Tax=Megasphaera hominis TaxID=159836 RepID=A0ABR6VJG4_9FIRM|nr:sigma 54-interacting transcriptional regulator [uncultured Megasphaera sp.]MBC3537422.1 sigma 54-interacting transcriptional regulator [Megasphaera hominis]
MYDDKLALHKPFRICVLGYSRLTRLSREVVAELPKTPDLEYIVFDSSLDERQDECIVTARRMGCEVFVAGPAAAVRFSNYYSYPLVAYQIKDIDYLQAIKKALDQGYTHIGITRYLYSPAANLDLYTNITGATLTELIYAEIPQMYEIAKHSDCDVLIGNQMTQEAAAAAKKPSLLLYAGKETIREACLKAGELARSLYTTRRNRAIAEAVLSSAQLGIVVTDTGGNVEFFNETMQNYTGISLTEASGQPLEGLFPNLPLRQFMKSPLIQNDSYHLINTTMMRCIFHKIRVGQRDCGVLMTFHPNPHNRKKDREQHTGVGSVYYLDKVTAHSQAMSRVVNQCNQISPVAFPTALIGPSGSGREELAHCLHNASRRAKKPCLTLNCAAIDEENAVRILYGYNYGKNATDGLLFNASGGSLIIKNLGLAGPRLQEILLQALTKHQFFQPGMNEPITFDILFFLVASPEEYRRIRPDLRRALAILRVTVPPLCERREDICDLFKSYVSQLLPSKQAQKLTPEMERLLTSYRYPGNVIELRAISTRYAVLLQNAAHQTARYRYNLLLDAIGRQTLQDDIYSRYPALTQRPITDTAGFRAGLALLHDLYACTYQELADQLALSRTTLWRLLHDKVPEKET